MRRSLRLLPLLAALLLLLPSASAEDAGPGVRRPVEALRALSAVHASRPAPSLGFLPWHAPRFGWFLLPSDDVEDDTEENVAAFDLSAERWMEDHVRGVGDMEGLAADLMERVALDIEVTTPGGEVARARLVVRPGQWRSWHVTRSVPVVLDYDPEVACDNSGGERPSVIGDPIPVAIQDGLVVTACATPLDAGRRVRLEATVQVGVLHVPRPIPTGARTLGALTLPAYRGALLHASGVVAESQALESRLETPDGGYGLHVVPTVQRAADRSSEARRLHWCGAGSLLEARSARSLGASEDEALDAASWPRARRVEPDLDARALRAALRRVQPRADVEVDGRGGVWVAGSKAAQAAVARTLDRLHERGGYLRMRIDLTAGDAPLATAVLSARDGETALARVGTDASYLLDADVEVG